jgi:hypothetical protein
LGIDDDVRALRIPMESFGVEEVPNLFGNPKEREGKRFRNRICYIIGDAYYEVDPSQMRRIQDAVHNASASDAGFIVQRLEKRFPGFPPAFLLYTGHPPPRGFVGVESLGALAATASFARHKPSVSGGRLNLTVVGDGDPIDFDAAKLTLALRFQPDARSSLPELTFEERFKGLPVARQTNLSMERVSFERCDGGLCLRQKVGSATLKVFGTAQEFVIYSLAAIREALQHALLAFNPGLLADDSPRRIDHAAFDALSFEVQRKIIDAAVREAREAFETFKKQSSTRNENAEVDIDLELQNQKESFRFADLQRSPATRIAARWTGAFR